MKTFLLTLILFAVPAFSQELPKQGHIQDLQYSVSTQTVVLPFVQMAIHCDNPKVIAFMVTMSFSNGDKPVTQTVPVYQMATGDIAFGNFIGSWANVASLRFEELESVTTLTISR